MKTKYLFFVIVNVLFASCHLGDSDLDPFFKTLENGIAPNTLAAFKNAPRDSCYYYQRKFGSPILRICDSLYSDDIEQHLIKHKIDPSIFKIYPYFTFHAWLHYERIVPEDIHMEIKGKAVKGFFPEQNTIGNINPFNIANDKNTKIGDVIEVTLPLMSYQGVLTTDYQQRISYQKINTKDSLTVSGILLLKRYEIENGKIDSSDLIFKLKILSLSNDSCKIIWKKRKIGDDFDLHLKYCEKYLTIIPKLTICPNSVEQNHSLD